MADEQEKKEDQLAPSLEKPAVVRKKENFFLETAKFIVITLLIVIPFRYFIAQPFIVSGDSMVPTFENGEYLIVDEISYRFDSPKRGDVIIFKYPLDKSKYFIKRVIGLPGETVDIAGSQVKIISTNGKELTVLNEPFVHSQRIDNLKLTLSDNEYFVMGDNRAASSDSRIWGPLPKKDIIGKPFIRLLPPSRIEFMPGSMAETGTTTVIK